MPITKEVFIPVKKEQIQALDINQDNRKKYILFLHGTGQNITHFQSLYKNIVQNSNYAVFTPEYRGFGSNSPADVSVKPLLEDASSALKYLKKEKGITNQDIILLGHSFGCNVATNLALKNQDLKEMILISPINSFKEDMDIKQALGKNVPKYAIFLLENIAFLSKNLENLYGIGDKIQKAQVPTDIIHSKSDILVNYNSSQKLADNANNFKSLNLLESGSHIIDSDKINVVTNILQKV